MPGPCVAHMAMALTGEHQNMLFPQLGKAGMPYAKSVPNVRAVHGSQPDPGDLFDRENLGVIVWAIT